MKRVAIDTDWGPVRIHSCPMAPRHRFYLISLIVNEHLERCGACGWFRWEA